MAKPKKMMKPGMPPPKKMAGKPPVPKGPGSTKKM